MASTVPAKSQPLHNFSSLSCLKWNSHPRNHRSSTTARRSSSPNQSSSFHDSPQRQSPLKHLLPSLRGDSTTEPLSSPSPPRQSPICGGYCDGSVSPPPSSDSPLLPGPSNDETPQPLCQSPIRGFAASESDSSLRNRKSLIEYRRQSRNSVPRTEKDGVSSPNRSVSPEKLEDQTEEPVSGNQEGKKESRSSRILIKLPPNEKKNSGEIKAQEEQTIDNSEIQGDGKETGALDNEEQVPKTWNFRPRKQTKQFFDYDGRVFRNSASAVKEKGVHSPQVKPADMTEAEKKEKEKKKKKKRGFTIALSKEEIEADVIALIGSKPSRRPKKRSRTAQKQLDFLFPGVWLQSVTADSYEVSENPGKG